MNFIVLDLEWNQCPTGKSDTIGQLPFEIIEIGAIKLDEALAIQDSFREVIRVRSSPCAPLILKTGVYFPKSFWNFLTGAVLTRISVPGDRLT